MNDPTEWVDIPPDSIIDSLYSVVCDKD